MSQCGSIDLSRREGHPLLSRFNSGLRVRPYFLPSRIQYNFRPTYPDGRIQVFEFLLET